jgi:hypothetical protein
LAQRWPRRFCRSTSREFLVDVTRRELFVLREIARILRHGMVREDAAPTLAAAGAQSAGAVFEVEQKDTSPESPRGGQSEVA